MNDHSPITHYLAIRETFHLAYYSKNFDNNRVTDISHGTQKTILAPLDIHSFRNITAFAVKSFLLRFPEIFGTDLHTPLSESQ